MGDNRQTLDTDFRSDNGNVPVLNFPASVNCIMIILENVLLTRKYTEVISGQMSMVVVTDIHIV